MGNVSKDVRACVRGWTWVDELMSAFGVLLIRHLCNPLLQRHFSHMKIENKDSNTETAGPHTSIFVLWLKKCNLSFWQTVFMNAGIGFMCRARPTFYVFVSTEEHNKSTPRSVWSTMWHATSFSLSLPSDQPALLTPTSSSPAVVQSGLHCLTDLVP